jgi:chaperonin GroES
MDMKLKPLGDRVLVERLEAEQVTEGGLVLPDSAKEKPREGKVIALGEGRLLDDGSRLPIEVKKGDRVIFDTYAGTQVKVDGDEFLVLNSDDILGVVE